MGLPYIAVENSGRCAHAHNTDPPNGREISNLPRCQVINIENLFEKTVKGEKDEEYGILQQDWTEEHAFVEQAGSAACLIN